MIPNSESFVDKVELAALSARFGEFTHWSRALDVQPGFMEQRIRGAQERRGEVVLLIFRPQGRVLLHTKKFYPAGAFRLPTGGIKLGEPVLEGARREMHEETGLDAELARLLGVVEYEFASGDRHAPFASYIFASQETAEPPQVVDPGEDITEFREVHWSDLERIARKLEEMPGEWRDWGRFRAVPHALAFQALKSMEAT